MTSSTPVEVTVERICRWPLALRSSGNRDFPFRMEGSLRAERTKNDGAVELLAEQFDTQVDFADVDHSARPQLVVRIGRAICPECVFSVHAADQVAPMGRRYIPVRHGLEIEHVQRVAGASDQTVAGGWAGVCAKDLLKYPSPAYSGLVARKLMKARRLCIVIPLSIYRS